MNLLTLESVRTPALIYDVSIFEDAIACARSLYDKPGYHVLYSVKACSVLPLLDLIATRVDGFSVSSLFEATLARSVLADTGSLHFTSPGLSDRDIGALCNTVNYFAFNSLRQFEQFGHLTNGSTKRGLRLNPKLSFVSDERYDPCRRYSKLGESVDTAIQAFGNKRLQEAVTGIHFHTNCESCDLYELFLTVKRIMPVLEAADGCVRWINLGGGYMFSTAVNSDTFIQTVDTLRGEFDLDVFVEPGAALVRDAGFLVSSVIDLFQSDGKNIAVLDTTVSHAPELLEFQFEPRVVNEQEDGPHRYLLSGCSCLAGDLFGEHCFARPLSIGSKVVFSEMGAYTLSKAQMFNGINLPSIYVQYGNDEPILVREFSYEDYIARHGGLTSATAGP